MQIGPVSDATEYEVNFDGRNQWSVTQLKPDDSCVNASFQLVDQRLWLTMWLCRKSYVIHAKTLKTQQWGIVRTDRHVKLCHPIIILRTPTIISLAHSLIHSSIYSRITI